MIKNTVNELIEYAKLYLDLKDSDAIYLKNILLGELKLSSPSYEKVDIEKIKAMKVPDVFIDDIKNYLCSSLNYSEHDADLFANKLMGFLTPLPSSVTEKFNLLEKESDRKALDYLYDLSVKNNYVAKTKIDKNLVWNTSFPDRNFEISINLSKPEKSNKDIAKLLVKSNSNEEKYPKCALCYENLGFYGNESRPARENIRLIPLKLDNENWYLQYSPYGYFNMHCIALKETHSNMAINKSIFTCLMDFIDRFPSFFIGSNADLPIVGGSILNHEHFQGGEHLLPVMRQEVSKEYKLTKFKNTKLYKLNWYNTCLLLEGEDREEIIELADTILNNWRKYDDKENKIISNDENGLHNTITPSIKKKGKTYYMYLILRNNRCNEEYPDGIFHAHPEHHIIKKEGIGIVEAMGLFILPARLVRQGNEIKDCLENNYSYEEIVNKYSDLKDFIPMINSLKENYSKDTIDLKIREYINNVCKGILENTAVFKETEKGNLGLDKFVGGMNL